MSNQTPFWYNLASSGYTSDLPPQAIPSSMKGEKWGRANMDSLERIGIKQFQENKRFADYYRMTEGKVSFMELSQIIPQLREISGLLEDLELPNTIKHYDILGLILNYLETVMFESRDKFSPQNIDEISSNEYIEKQTELLRAHIKEQVDKRIKIALAKAGFDLNRQEFSSEQEKQQYIQEIEAATEELTPAEIKKYLKNDFRTDAILWAEYTLEADAERFRLNEITRENIKDYLRTGRCFREYKVKYDSYEISRWHPIETFFSQTTDSKYTQYGEYVGRIHFYTPSDFINAKGYYFNEKQQKKILNAFNTTKNGTKKEWGLEEGIRNGMSERSYVPFENFHDYNFLLDLQNLTGVPLANRTIIKKDGTTEEITDYLPERRFNGNPNVLQYARFIRDDLNLRSDLIMVTEAYWRSYQRVGYLTYLDKEGMLKSDIVTDEILSDFLEEYEISVLKEVTLEDLRKNERKPNTIAYFYLPQIWKGEKANTSATQLGEDTYYGIEPLEFQIKGEGNIFDLSLPVVGLVDNNPSDKIMPFQNLYNIAMNKQVNLQEKELGMFLLYDVNFIPSDIKEYGDSETSLYNLISIIKDTGIAGIDASASNLKLNGNAFNQFAMQNGSLGGMIREKQEQAQMYKMQAFEQFGLNPSVLGQPVKYMTASGVEQTNIATQTQTDYLYDAFSNFESRALETHLNVAQFAQGDGRDISLEYTKSDLTKAFLKFSDPKFPLRRFGIMAISNTKKRRELELIKNYMLNNNTMDRDEMTLASIVGSDSLHTLMEIAKQERERKLQLAKEEKDHQEKLVNLDSNNRKIENYIDWQLEEISNQRDRVNRIETEKIQALGRAVDNNSSEQGIQQILDSAEMALKEKQIDATIENNNQNREILREQVRSNAEKARKELDLKEKELRLKKEQLQNERFIAMINKN